MKCTECADGFIQGVPSGTFSVGGVCDACQAWYGYESGRDGKGFYRDDVQKEKLQWALEHKNLQRRLSGLEELQG